MLDGERPKFFYLFNKGADIEVLRMTDMEARTRLDRGETFEDMPQQTRENADELRLLILSGRKRKQKS